LAANDEEVNRAVERAVAYLKTNQNPDGTWPYAGSLNDSSHPVGVSALVGLALLECNVAREDPVIQKAARVVRNGLRQTTETYDLALTVMFLDRLGDPADDPLVEAAALSLVAGQMPSGGWGYTCPRLVLPQNRRLQTLTDKKALNQRGEPATETEEPRPRGGAVPARGRGNFRAALGDDNSNTQFATLALWIARRHRVRVNHALGLVETRFRQSQNLDGGWGYKSGGSLGRFGNLESTASMTCAGLLGLAVGYGVSLQSAQSGNVHPKQSGAARKDRILPQPDQDQAIRRGLDFVGQVMESTLRAETEEEPPERGPNRRGPPGGRGRGPGRLGGQAERGPGSAYYFLWSLERVAVVYQLQTIGNQDWFAVGSRFLLSMQANDGAWRGNLGDIADTCFALFFLRRANLANDLTATLRGTLKEPGVAHLKASGGPAKQEPAAKKPATPAAMDEDSRSSATGKATTKPSTPIAHSVEKSERREQEIARLRDLLVKSAAAEQASILAMLRDEKGAVYTDALAAAIPLLSGAAKKQAGDALAERLARMTAATLRDKLNDSNLEVRRAAALACAMKEDLSFVSDLIGLLENADPRVTRAAHAALEALTHQDFGPAIGATTQERTQASARWREWWKNQSNNH
jgi:hypothetical protein